ncbi:hypothetical protein HK102_008452, partial [Quaeritorhiza haematococci]
MKPIIVIDSANKLVNKDAFAGGIDFVTTFLHGLGSVGYPVVVSSVAAVLNPFKSGSGVRARSTVRYVPTITNREHLLRFAEAFLNYHKSSLTMTADELVEVLGGTFSDYTRVALARAKRSRDAEFSDIMHDAMMYVQEEMMLQSEDHDVILDNNEMAYSAVKGKPASTSPSPYAPVTASLILTYEVPDVYLFPNIYCTLNTVEYAVSQLRTLLRERPHYASTPICITETHCHHWVLKRLLLSGANIITQFNIFAYHQEGRQNGMALDFPTFNDTLLLLKSASDCETTTILPVSGADHRVWVKNRAVGVNDPTPKQVKSTTGSHFVKRGWFERRYSWINYYGTEDIVLKDRDVEAFGAKFPVYSKLTVPTECLESITKGPAPERRYTMFIPINIPIGDSGFKVDYATSEILTFRT